MVNEVQVGQVPSSDSTPHSGDPTTTPLKQEVNGNDTDNNMSVNGHSSPVLEKITSSSPQQSHSPVNQQQIHVSNGDHVASSAPAIVLTSDARYSLAGQQVLQPHEIYIKAEPMDPMPPLASPMQNPREMEDSPPATLISLTPAQPAYDVNGAGQYNGIVYLTADYSNYRDYYTAAPNQTTQLQLHSVNASSTVASTDQYQAVRQQLTSTPAVTYTTAQAVIDGQPQEGTSFLDRYLRQPPVSTTAVVSAHAVYNGQLQGGLTVDLPSPDSGIGEAIVTPRPENGILAQVYITFSERCVLRVKFLCLRLSFLLLLFSSSHWPGESLGLFFFSIIILLPWQEFLLRNAFSRLLL